METEMTEKRRTTVIIESPYAGDVEVNKAYARACMKDSLSRGEAPFLSHLLYTQVLDDTIPEQRKAGIEAGLVIGEAMERTVLYKDLGVSSGMQWGIDAAYKVNRPIDRRMLNSENPELWEAFIAEKREIQAGRRS